MEFMLVCNRELIRFCLFFVVISRVFRDVGFSFLFYVIIEGIVMFW